MGPKDFPTVLLINKQVGAMVRSCIETVNLDFTIIDEYANVMFSQKKEMLKSFYEMFNYDDLIRILKMQLILMIITQRDFVFNHRLKQTPKFQKKKISYFHQIFGEQFPKIYKDVFSMQNFTSENLLLNVRKPITNEFEYNQIYSKYRKLIQKYMTNNSKNIYLKIKQQHILPNYSQEEKETIQYYRCKLEPNKKYYDYNNYVNYLIKKFGKGVIYIQEIHDIYNFIKFYYNIILENIQKNEQLYTNIYKVRRYKTFKKSVIRHYERLYKIDKKIQYLLIQFSIELVIKYNGFYYDIFTFYFNSEDYVIYQDYGNHNINIIIHTYQNLTILDIPYNLFEGIFYYAYKTNKKFQNLTKLYITTNNDYSSEIPINNIDNGDTFICCEIVHNISYEGQQIFPNITTFKYDCKKISSYDIYLFFELFSHNIKSIDIICDYITYRDTNYSNIIMTKLKYLTFYSRFFGGYNTNLQNMILDVTKILSIISFPNLINLYTNSIDISQLSSIKYPTLDKIYFDTYKNLKNMIWITTLHHTYHYNAIYNNPTHISIKDSINFNLLTINFTDLTNEILSNSEYSDTDIIEEHLIYVDDSITYKKQVKKNQDLVYYMIKHYFPNVKELKLKFK